MDDLLDAIQDAEYIGAMCNPAPMPSDTLRLVSDAEALAFAQRIKAGNPEALTFETILSETLGYYLFKQHLESQGSGIMLMFVEATLAFSAVSTADVRLRKGQDIVRQFFPPPPVPDATALRGGGVGTDGDMFRVALRDRETISSSHDLADSLSFRSTGVDPSMLSLPGLLSTTGSSVDGQVVVNVSSVGQSPRRGVGGPPVDSSPAIGEGKPLPNVRSLRHVFHSKLELSAGSPSASGGGSGSGSGILRGSGMDVRRVAPEPPSSGVKGLDDFGGSYTDATGITVGTGTVTVPPLDPLTSGVITVSSDMAMADPIASLRHALRFRNGENVRQVIAKRQKSMSVRAKAAALYSRYKSMTSPIGVDGDIVEVARSLVQACSLPLPVHKHVPVIVECSDGVKPSSPELSRTTSGLSSTARSPPHAQYMTSIAIIPPTLFQELTDAVIEACRARFWSSFLDSPLYLKYLKFKQLESQPVSIADFVQFRILGRGGFGSVNGCRKRNTGKLYAMKVMNKKRIKQKNASDLCWNERVVLSRVNSPFVVSLKYAFQTPEELFLIMDMMPGGDLAYHLGKYVRFSENQARFYAAEILLGLEHLHSLNIVYRDLKPENMLLDMEGHCRITDMGLATHVTSRLAGRCGTRGYWAPEMLIKVDGKRQVYGFSVDWWSFGCLLYEFLFGKCPFRTDSARSLDPDKHKSMDKATLHLEVPYPSRYFSPEATSLIKGLLTRDPLLRLGSKGAAEVKAHPFFASIDWGMLETGQISPPFRPEQSINAASQDAIGAFESMRKVALEVEDHSKFDGWITVNKHAFQTEVVEYLAWEKATGSVGPKRPMLTCCVHQ